MSKSMMAEIRELQAEATSWKTEAETRYAEVGRLKVSNAELQAEVDALAIENEGLWTQMWAAKYCNPTEDLRLAKLKVTEFNRIINFALEECTTCEAKEVLFYWREGDWDACRKYGFEPALKQEGE